MTPGLENEGSLYAAAKRLLPLCDPAMLIQTLAGAVAKFQFWPCATSDNSDSSIKPNGRFRLDAIFSMG